MPKTKSEYVREIKRLNARFRKLKKRDGLMADRIATRKDALIDAMQAECQHPMALEDISPPNGRSMQRTCCNCGLTDLRSLDFGFIKLKFADMIQLDHATYIIKQGQILKKLGFNL